MAVATVATSAVRRDERTASCARHDAVTLDRERLLADAKADALALAEAKDTWRVAASRRRRRSACPVRAAGSCWSRSVDNLRLQGKASEHDAVVAGKLAYVLTGGDCSPLDDRSPSRTSSTWSARRSSACAGMPKTQERMEALLTTGKPLRN